MIFAKACRIKVVNGKHSVAMPDGTVLPRQLSCKVITRVNELPYAIVKLQVNLDDTYPIEAPAITEEEKRFVDSVPIDAEDINRRFNHG